MLITDVWNNEVIARIYRIGHTTGPLLHILYADVSEFTVFTATNGEIFVEYHESADMDALLSLLYYRVARIVEK